MPQPREVSLLHRSLASFLISSTGTWVQHALQAAHMRPRIFSSYVVIEFVFMERQVHR
jgi:hypothetical protein